MGSTWGSLTTWADLLSWWSTDTEPEPEPEPEPAPVPRSGRPPVAPSTVDVYLVARLDDDLLLIP